MALLAYLAVAALLLWLTRIAYRPIGRAAALTLMLSPLALSGPALVAGRVLGPIDLPYWSEPLAAYRELLGPGPFSPPVLNDVSSQMIPWRTAVRRALAAGEWPLWNPSILSGDILLASGQPSALAPLSLAELLLPPALAIGFSATLTLFVAALGTFLFLRHVRVSVSGSLLGAVAWSWSGFLIFWLHWPQGRSAAHLPWILLAVSWLVRRDGVRPLLALAALLANLLLSGHPETALHVVALGGAFAIFRLVRRSRRQRLPALVRGLSAGALALMLAALFWLPVAAALLESHELPLRRSQPERWGELSMSESAPKLLPHFAPLVFGQSSVNEGATPDGWALPGTSYIGSALLPLILVGTFAVRFRHRAFAIGLALFCLAAAVSAPPVVWLLQRLPLFSIALNERLAFGAAFGLAWCAAIGFDRLFGAMRSRAPELGRSGGTLVAV